MLTKVRFKGKCMQNIDKIKCRTPWGRFNEDKLIIPKEGANYLYVGNGTDTTV